MKNHIIKIIGCIAATFVLAGWVHTANTAAQKDTKPPVTISIARDGALSVAGEQCRQSELTARIIALAAKQPTAVVVRADAGAPFKNVAAVMDACEAAGVRPISLATTK